MTYSYVYAGPPAGPGQDPAAALALISSMPVTTVVPEPASLALAGIGGAACMMMLRKARRVRTTAV